MWQNMSPQQQAVWYQNEQKNGFGKKRKFDSITFSETSGTTAESRDQQLLNMLPITKFIREKFLEGDDRTTAIRKFATIVQNNPGICRFANGQWHVPDYGGLVMVRGLVHTNGFSSSRNANIQDVEQLNSLRSQGRDSLLQMQMVQNAVPMAAPEIPVDMPALSRTPAESAQPPPEPVGLESHIAREARGMEKIYRTTSDQGRSRAIKG